MNLITAAEAALAELSRYHTHQLRDFLNAECPGPDNCPTAAAIRDLELAIGEAKLESVGIKRALEEAFGSGFGISSEGFNGEYPFGDNDKKSEEDPEWIELRRQCIARITAKLEDQDPEFTAVAPHKIEDAPQRLCVNCDKPLDADNRSNTCPDHDPRPEEDVATMRQHFLKSIAPL